MADNEKDLVLKLNEQANSLIQKKLILDARDKLIRLKQSRQTDISKAVALVGTCPDMCPEQERYFRIESNQVSTFELNFANNPNGEIDEKLMVKEYRRSGADQEEPLPHELRPINVLERTMNYLCLKIIDDGYLNPENNLREWFDFIWSRTRSIRKDITQQHLINLESVSLIEKCARFHIFCSYYLCEEEMKDFDPKINEENLSNCLQTLKDFYYDLSIRSIYCPNESEFRAYDILLNLDNGETLSELKYYRSVIKNSKDVLLAIKLYQSFDCNNYYQFFRLVRQADFFKSCILNRYFNRFRIKAFNIQRKAFTNSKSTVSVPYPINNLIYSLGFDDFNEFSKFCDSFDLNYDQENFYFQRHCVIEQNNFKRKSIVLVAKKLKTTPGCAILGLDTDQNLLSSIRSNLIKQVHCSFDQNNRFIGDLKANTSLSFFNEIRNDTIPRANFFGVQITHPTNQIGPDESKTINSFNFKLSQFNTSDQKTLDDSRLNETNPTVFGSFVWNQSKFQVPSSFSPTFKTDQMTRVVDENENDGDKREEQSKRETIDHRKIIQSMCSDIFQSIVEECLRKQCQSMIEHINLLRKILFQESEAILKDSIEFSLRELLQNFYRMNQIANECYRSIQTQTVRLNVRKNLLEIKRKKFIESIRKISIQILDEFETILIKKLANVTLQKYRSCLERIRLLHRLYLERKYFQKWRIFSLQRKRFKFYRDTFPALPVSNLQNAEMEVEQLFRENKSTIVDEQFIRLNETLKRKLFYLKFNDFESTINLVNENSKRYKTESRNFDQHRQRLDDFNHNASNQFEKFKNENFLCRKYFQKWLKSLKERKNKRIRLEFPSVPSMIMGSPSKLSSDRQMISCPQPPSSTSSSRSEALNRTQHRGSIDCNGTIQLTIIDPLIADASSSIKKNLQERLNQEHRLTVSMLEKTLTDYYQRREQDRHRLQQQQHQQKRLITKN